MAQEAAGVAFSDLDDGLKRHQNMPNRIVDRPGRRRGQRVTSYSVKPPLHALAAQTFPSAVIHALGDLPLRLVPDLLVRVLRAAVSRHPRQAVHKVVLGLAIGGQLATNPEYQLAVKEAEILSEVVPAIDVQVLFTQLRG